MLSLTEHLGQPVLLAGGAPLGRLVDVAVTLAAPVPRATRLLVRTGRGRTRTVDWAEVVEFTRAHVRLAHDEAALADGGLRDDELLVMRDVVDSQIVDIDGWRVVRAADAEFDGDVAELRLVAVDVGLASLLRRLGLTRLARRARREAIDWEDLHPGSPRGHELQVRCRADAIRRLGPAELGHVVASLPPHRAASILELVGPQRAREAMHAARARHRRRRRFPHRKRRRERA